MLTELSVDRSIDRLINNAIINKSRFEGQTDAIFSQAVNND